jgi:3',5'-cyclic AMP phosphodiesterase CpdA
MKRALSEFRNVCVWATLGLLAFLLPAAGCAAPSGSSSVAVRFYFVQITDTHFGDRDHLERTRQLVDQINRLPYEIACVVHTGDVFADNITDETIATQGLAILGRLKAPLHILPGNHDILQGSLDQTFSAFTRRIGPPIQKTEYHGVVFLCAYTEPAALGFTAPGYDALQELEAALASAAGRPVVVFHHRPAVEDFYSNALHPGWDGEGRRRLEALLLGHNVKAVVTGHFHRDELHWLEGIPVFAAPPVAGYWGRQASFRLYEYRDGRVGYRTIYLQD